VGDIHQPLHVGSIYFDRECDDVVDPNVVGAHIPNFGIGTIVAETTGGNDLMRGTQGLHSYWDDNTVEGAMRAANIHNGSIKDFAQWIVDHPTSGWETSGPLDSWSSQWATEILPLAKDALTRINIGEPQVIDAHALKCSWPVTLKPGYAKWADGQALTQLSKAGFRLAALLRGLFQNP